MFITNEDIKHFKATLNEDDIDFFESLSNEEKVDIITSWKEGVGEVVSNIRFDDFYNLTSEQVI